MDVGEKIEGFFSNFSSDPEEALKKLILDNLENRYQVTGNPLFVWRALQHCNRFSLNVPSWVQKYLFESAENLMGDILQRREDIERKTSPGIRAERIVYESLYFKRDAFNNYCKILKKDEVLSLVLVIEKFFSPHWPDDINDPDFITRKEIFCREYNINPPPTKATKEDIFQAAEQATGVNSKTIEAWHREQQKEIGTYLKFTNDS